MPEDGPKFVTGYSLCIGFTILSIIASSAYGVGCWYANKQRDRRSGEDHGLTREEKMDLGDLAPEYRYLL